jgi:hypothetical protein
MADENAKAGVALHDTGDYNLSKPTYNGVPQEAASDEAKENAQNPADQSKPFSVFLKDRIKSHMIVMNIPGNIDTTEAGIFFSYTENGTKIDISSLSTTAKRTVAQAVFGELDKKYKRIIDDKAQ